MRPGGSRTYADVTEPLRVLTNKNIWFKWTKECQKSFEELKSLLCSSTVLANYELHRKTRLYVDHGPFGVASTIAQEHQVPGSTDIAWRPVFYTSRALTITEQNYTKVKKDLV